METSRENKETIENISIDSINNLNEYSIQIELGDIVEIIAPSNTEIHETTGIISYKDLQQLHIISISTTKTIVLKINEDGSLSDESITNIHILNKSEEKGFARQNNLLPKTWVDIHFGGEIPTIITGEITNLEEDMIEITTFPDIVTIYLNFGYNGIPQNLPIEQINIRAKPDILKNVPSLAIVRQELEDGEIFDPVNFQQEDNATIEFTETGESIINIPDDGIEEENIREKLQELYIDANSIIFGESLEGIAQAVEIPEHEKRYGIEEQVNDLMDELLSTIPNNKRTAKVMNNIYLLIDRFKDLRLLYSKFDENQNIYDIDTKGAHYKPLVEKIYRINTQLKWIIPIVVNKKHIYTNETIVETSDVIYEEESSDLIRLSNLQNLYFQNSNNNQLSYESLNRRTDSILKPISNPTNYNYFEPQDVLTNIDVIVDNLNEFNSTVYNNSNIPIRTRKFLIQRYNLGLSYITKEDLKSGKSLYVRRPMTSNDNIAVKSVLVMPEPVVKMSSINLPTKNILDKANLHENYRSIFRLLTKNTDITTHVITDLSKEYNYESSDFLSGIHEFILSPEISDEQNNSDKFKRFLDVIIPKTRDIINIIRKHIKNKLSFISVVKELESFMIYPSDISYKQYNEIKMLIRDKIKDLKVLLSERSKDFNKLKNYKYNVQKNTNPLLLLINTSLDFSDTFFESYKLLAKDKKETNLTPQELLLHMNSSDNSNLYTNIINSILISLITPENMTNALNKPNIDDLTDNEKIKAKDCSQRVLTKKYTSMNELQKDNNNDEVFYDKEYDNTPYDLLEKYKEDQEKLTPDLFHEFLMENLIHKHDCPNDDAKQVASDIIFGKKYVKTGEYAMLEIKPTLQDGRNLDSLSDKQKESVDIEQDIRKKVSYYRRVKDNWVSDTSIDEEIFMDTATLFCNISKECYKNTKNNICESTEQTTNRLKTEQQQKLLSEFDKRFEITLEELEQKLEDNIAYHLKMLNKTSMLKEIQLYKANNLAYNIGMLANNSDILVSSHIELRDLIMGQDNFTKKQSDIIKFCRLYCREPLESINEDNNWLYCLDTNTKLFPKTILILANTFINNNNYNEKLNQLCHTHGVIDGNNIVDKYTGYTLRKLDFSSEEGFDEKGFMISSRDIMERDIGTVVMESLGKKPKRVFENKVTETIYNIYSTLASNIDINVDGIDEFILRTSNEIINKDIISEATYLKKSKKYEKEKGKPLPPYQDYYNEIMILIISSILFVGIQTSIPSYQPTKTFPGCVRSLTGYPLTGVEDTTGIKYISCVLNKIKSNISPWNSIKKNKAETLAAKIQDIISKYILKRNDIEELYIKKKEYLILNPDVTIPNEHNIIKWTHFLPPIVQFSVASSLRGVSNDFQKEFNNLLRLGNKDQFKSISVFKSKISQYSYGIIEYINHIVRNKDLLLKTSSKIPFLENACCNEKSLVNPIVYFNEENENIKIAINVVLKISAILKDIDTLSRPPLLYHPDFTGIKYSNVTSGDIEELIYSTIIYYCNFDRDLPVPDNYKIVCSEKPSGYDSKSSMLNKIEFLKKNGKKFTENDFHKLMKLVFEKNMVSTDDIENINQVTIFKEIIANLERSSSSIIEEPLRKHLLKNLNKYDPKKMINEKSEELKSLNKYLTRTNTLLLKEINEFLDKHGNLSDTNFKKIQQFLYNITSWSFTEKDTDDYSDSDLYTIIQFIKNSAFSFSNIYPSALLNEEPFYYNIPKHWGVSQFHKQDIINFIKKYYERLNKFTSDNILNRLLVEVKKQLSTISLFMQNIPLHTDINKKNEEGLYTSYHSIFDKDTVYKLFSYCFYSIIYEYIILSNDKDLLRADVEISKLDKRNNIEYMKNTSNSLYSENELSNDNEELSNDLLEIQIETGNSLELKERVASLLISFIEIEIDNKKTINLTYDEISKKVNRYKDIERQRIFENLGRLSIEDRKIEDTNKRYKLGDWNIGMQKGIFQYDPATYDRERNNLFTDINDVEETEKELEAFDIDELDNLDNQEINDDYNRDTFNFEELQDDLDDYNSDFDDTFD